jgi:hypothetical protein
MLSLISGQLPGGAFANCGSTTSIVVLLAAAVICRVVQ